MDTFRNFLSRNLVLILSFFIISCCTTNNLHDTQKSFNIQEESMLEKAKLSAVKVTVGMHIAIKDKVSTSTKTEAEEMEVYTGSGVIIDQVDNGTFILTAGHVCNHVTLNTVLFHFPYYKENVYDVMTGHKFVITDTDDVPHAAIMVALSREADVCILLSTPINQPAVKLSKDKLRPSQRVYSVSFPRGIWQKGYNPILQGYYVGNLSTKNRETPAFSLRSAPGCSGGMIINFDGELVGMIHSLYLDFDQLTLGASLSQITGVLEMADFMYSIGKDEYQLALAKEFVSFHEQLENTTVEK